jgi:phosphatidylglycerophosphate synthase
MATATAGYRIIRRDFQHSDPLEVLLVDRYGMLLSPWFTRMFVRARIAPNRVTLLMMASGAAGAILFAFPQTALKAAGLLCIHLWLVLDCSDGEVARITRRFSTFGRELDYTAHVVCHPLFNLAFASSLVSMGRYNPMTIWMVAGLSISAEMVIRNILAFDCIYALKMQRAPTAAKPRGLVTIMAIQITNIFSLYPNFAVIFPIVFLIDRYCGTPMAIFYLYLYTGVSTLLALRMMFKWIRSIVDA